MNEAPTFESDIHIGPISELLTHLTHLFVI